MSIEPGAAIGTYIIEQELGRGGMGVVYRAQDLVLKRPVALKLLAPRLLQDASARARFQKEIQFAVAIEHPHVVPIYAAGYEDGQFFLAMRLVRGPDLAEILQQDRPLPEERVARLIGQIASALFAVHERGMIHRDVKPQNVLVWNAEEIDEHCFLTDFGIAKALNDTIGFTSLGVVGTRGYIAPELFTGAQPTPACDQYSLACVAYQLLSGHLPNEDASGHGERASPIPLRLHRPRVSARLEEAVERALAPNPRDRYPDVRAFANAYGLSQEAFEESREVTETITGVDSDSELVARLTEHGLSDARIGEIADLERSEVVRLRRQAARRSVIGE